MELIEINNQEIANPEIRNRDAMSSRCAYTRHFLAVESGLEVGLLSIDIPPSEEQLIIYEIFVPTALRRHGIGTRLLAAAEEMTRDLGYETVLLVPKTLDQAFAQQMLEEWYARKGYAPLQDSANGAIVKRVGR